MYSLKESGAWKIGCGKESQNKNQPKNTEEESSERASLLIIGLMCQNRFKRRSWN